MADTDLMPLGPLALAAAQETWTREQVEVIKSTCAPNATDAELALFLHTARASGLDPLQKQIWFVKRYLLKKDANGKPILDANGQKQWQVRVDIQAAADGLQARALRFADCEGIRYAAVHEDDEFLVDRVTGEVVQHRHNPFKAGPVLGAWACVDRAGKRPFFVVVRFEEFDDPNSPLWKAKPATMIEKVARATACRRAYPEFFGSIYDPAEIQAPTEEEDIAVTVVNGALRPPAEAARPARPSQVREEALRPRPAAPSASSPDDPTSATPQENARQMARDARDLQTRADALATGIAPEHYRAWVERVLEHPLPGVRDYLRTLTDEERDTLDREVQARRANGAAPPPPRAQPAAPPARAIVTVAPGPTSARPARALLRPVRPPQDTIQKSLTVEDAVLGTSHTATAETQV